MLQMLITLGTQQLQQHNRKPLISGFFQYPISSLTFHSSSFFILSIFSIGTNPSFLFSLTSKCSMVSKLYRTYIWYIEIFSIPKCHIVVSTNPLYQKPISILFLGIIILLFLAEEVGLDPNATTHQQFSKLCPPTRWIHLPYLFYCSKKRIELYTCTCCFPGRPYHHQGLLTK
jgi:hypothetical protein